MKRLINFIFLMVAAFVLASCFQRTVYDEYALVHLIHVDREVVLIVADTLSGTGTVFSDELAKHGIGFFYTIFLLVGGINGLVHDER